MNQRPHKNLVVWKESIELIKYLYKITSTFPEDEKYGIVSQMKRAAVSIILNIAEGAARNTKKDFNHFLNFSQGSLSEIDALAEVSYALHYITKDVFDEMMQKLSKISALLQGLINSNNKT